MRSLGGWGQTITIKRDRGDLYFRAEVRVMLLPSYNKAYRSLVDI